MQYSFGMAPSYLVFLPAIRVMSNMPPDVNNMDHIPMVNIMPFRMCISMPNPTAAAATAAALAVLTHIPCIPAILVPCATGASTPLPPNFHPPANASHMLFISVALITFITPADLTAMIPQLRAANVSPLSRFSRKFPIRQIRFGVKFPL